MVNDDTNIIIKEIYPIVSNKLSSDNGKRKFLNNIAKFINKRHSEIHATAPYTRILFGANDVKDLFNSLDLNENDIKKIMENCYFWNKQIHPRCVKEPYVQVLLCAIIFFLNDDNHKNAELTTIFLLFSGKFYASLHFKLWKYPPNEAVMDYVVNNMLSDKFDLKREGTIFKSLRKLGATWIETYENKLRKNSLSDDNIKLLIQQLRDRLKSFLRNIAVLYYQAVEEKNYLNYETDNLDNDNFRLTNNDATTAARLTAAATSLLISQKIDLNLCRDCLYKVTTFDASTLCDIMEGIVSDRNNIPEIRTVINVIICDYLANSGLKSKVGGADFISYSIKAKPNTKSKMLIEMKATIIKWLEANSTKFKNSKREATRNDYYRAVLMYLVLTICKVSNR